MVDERAQIWEKLGRCYVKLEDYRSALMAFKTQLKIGWISNKRSIELIAYDNIGMAYYYLGDLEGAQYYHKRMADGVVEPINSTQRVYCISNEATRKSQAMLQRSGLITHRMSTEQLLALTASSAGDKGDLLYAECKLATEDDETPRIVQNEPLLGCKDIDLPSPRRNRTINPDFDFSSASRSLTSCDASAGKSQRAERAETGEKSRAFLAKLRCVTAAIHVKRIR